MISLAAVLVVAAEKVERVAGAARLVSPSRRPVEPLVHAPQAVQAARVGRVRAVDDPVLERERAHAGALARVGRPVGARGCGPRVERPAYVLGRRPYGRLAEVVLEDARTLLLLGEDDVEVVVEVASERGGPGEAPAHPLLVALQLLEWSARHRPEHHVVVGQVNREAVEAVGDRRAGGAARGEVGPEHEVVDEQLRAPPEQAGQRRRSLVGLEPVLLVDPEPGELLALPRHFVAVPRQLLLRIEQLQPGGTPLFTCSGLVTGHCWASFSFFPCLCFPCRLCCLACPAAPAPAHIGGTSPAADNGARARQMPSPTIASAGGTSTAPLAGRSFWARTSTAITDIQAMFMTLTATSMAISPALEPVQQRPNPNPERAPSRQRWRKCRLSGVSSYTPAAIVTAPAAMYPCGRYSAYTATPTRAQMAR